MNLANPGPVALALILFMAASAAADVPLNGVTIGTSVNALVQALGPPVSVISADAGNEFVFAGGTTAYVDDDGSVLAVEMQAGSARVAIDGTVHVFRIGSYSAARAEAELANVAEFNTPNLRSYRLAPRRDLVLRFAASSQQLERVTYGEPGQLARLGLLPGDAAAKAVAYHAPQLRRPAVAVTPPGSQTSVYRIAIDRAGAVTRVDSLIASALPSGDEELARLRSDRYTPATLDGRPIAAAIFVELRH